MDYKNVTFCRARSLPFKSSFCQTNSQIQMKRSYLFIPVCLLAFFACKPLNQPEPPASAETVQPTFTAAWSGEEVVLTNNTALDVYYVAFPVRILPVILYTTSTNPRVTSKVAPNSTMRFRRDYFFARNPDTLFVSWWHLGTKLNDSLYNPDSVRSFHVFP